MSKFTAISEMEFFTASLLQSVSTVMHVTFQVQTGFFAQDFEIYCVWFFHKFQFLLKPHKKQFRKSSVLILTNKYQNLIDSVKT